MSPTVTRSGIWLSNAAAVVWKVVDHLPRIPHCLPWSTREFFKFLPRKIYSLNNEQLHPCCTNTTSTLIILTTGRLTSTTIGLHGERSIKKLFTHAIHHTDPKANISSVYLTCVERRIWFCAATCIHMYIDEENYSGLWSKKLYDLNLND